MQGYDFPIFKSGVNNISWVGTVTKIEILHVGGAYNDTDFYIAGRNNRF